MKKFLAILLMTVSVSAFAWNNGYRGGYNGYRGQVYYNNGYYNNNYWVAPALAGVAVGALATRSYYAPPPVVYQQPVYIQTPVYVQPNPAPIGYTQQQILDANCNCWRTVLVPQ
jgi:hypothetical protein